MALDIDQKKKLYTNLARAVAFDQMMMRVIRAGKMVGFYHEGGIALAPGVAAGSFLTQSDFLWPHYRAHGLAHMLSKNIDVTSYVAEHMGRIDGCCRGRSSFHFSYPNDRVYGYSGNIGANFPASVGYGYAAKYKNTDEIVMNCSGDGSYGEGRAHEALLMAANWKLPIVFWCESNGMAQYSEVSDLFPGPQISSLAGGFGIPARVVDGQNVFECGEAALAAIEHCRSGKGPIFIELMTLRPHEHNVGGLNNAGALPRDQKLMEELKSTRNPLLIAGAQLIDEGVLSSAEIDAIRSRAEHEAKTAEEVSDAQLRAEPSIAELLADVYAI